MATLSDYTTEVTDLLHDTGLQFYSQALITRNINAARKQVARKGLCIRAVPTPGTGANQLATVAAQEAYTFSSVSTIISASGLSPGVGNIFTVVQVCVSWGGIIPSMRRFQWNTFNAWYRSINVTGLQGFPACYAQYGQGGSGQIYLYPIPTSATAMLWDCACDPLPLTDDDSPDAIPEPYTDAVKFYAQYLCYLNSQRRQDANSAFADYRRAMAQAGAAVYPWSVPDWYKVGWSP